MADDVVGQIRNVVGRPGGLRKFREHPDGRRAAPAGLHRRRQIRALLGIVARDRPQRLDGEFVDRLGPRSGRFRLEAGGQIENQGPNGGVQAGPQRLVTDRWQGRKQVAETLLAARRREKCAVASPIGHDPGRKAGPPRLGGRGLRRQRLDRPPAGGEVRGRLLAEHGGESADRGRVLGRVPSADRVEQSGRRRHLADLGESGDRRADRVGRGLGPAEDRLAYRLRAVHLQQVLGRRPTQHERDRGGRQRLLRLQGVEDVGDALHLPLGVVDDGLELRVCGAEGRLEHGVSRCRAGERHRRLHDFGPNEGRLVGRGLGQQRLPAGDRRSPVAERADGRGTDPRLGGAEHLHQQSLVGGPVLLHHPQAFEERLGVVGIGRVERRRPRPDGRHDVGRLPAGEFEPAAVPGGVLLGEERLLKNRGDRLSLEPHRLDERTVLGGHPVDPAVGVVAVRVAHVVLHVADDGVGPVGDVQGAVGTDLQVGGAEIGIARHDDRLDLPGRDLGAVVLHLVLEHAEEADRVADQEVAPVLLREMAARQEAGRGHGANPLGEPGLVAHPLADVDVRADARRAVVGELVAPLVEDVAVGVGADGEVELDLERPRIEPMHAGRGGTHRPRRRLHRRDVEHAPRPVEPAVGADEHRVGGMVRVGAVEPLEHAELEVCLAVAVGVLEEPDLRKRRHQHPPAPELEAGDAVEAVGERHAAVRHAVAVVVGQADDLVEPRLGRIPVRVGRPHGDEQHAIRIDRHLHGVGHLGKHLLGRKQVDLHPVGDLHPLDRLLAPEIDVPAPLELPGNVGLHRGLAGKVVVLDDEVAPLGDGPDPGVAVGRHDVEDLHLAHHHVGVRLAEPGELGAAAEHVVAVDHPVAAEPVVVLVEHRLPEPLERRLGGRACPRKQVLHDHVGHGPIALVEQVDAVHRQRLRRRGVEPLRRREQVDEHDLFFPADAAHGIGVQGEEIVVGGAVGEVRIVEILVGDRREEDEPRRRPAVVLLPAHAVDRRRQFLPEGVQAPRAAQGLVAAEEGENHARLDLGEPLVRRAEVLLARPDGELVAGEAEVAKHELQAGVGGVDPRLQPAGVLHPVGERVADDGDAVPLLEHEPGLGGSCGRDGSGGQCGRDQPGPATPRHPGPRASFPGRMRDSRSAHRLLPAHDRQPDAGVSARPGISVGSEKILAPHPPATKAAGSCRYQPKCTRSAAGATAGRTLPIGHDS